MRAACSSATRVGGRVVAVVVVVVVAGAGCGPSDVCRDYVACQVAVDDRVDVSAYDDGGSCWDLPSTSRACSARCEEALRALQVLPDAPDACFPDGRDAALAPAP